MLAVVLPIIMLLAIDKRNVFENQEGISNSNERAMDRINSVNNDLLKIDLLGSNKTVQAMELELYSPLKSPAALLYLIDENGNKILSLGELGAQGKYQFAMEQKASGILIYDPIKKAIITKILF